MNICVFLGSSIGKDPLYAETAFELGKQIAISNHKLVYGGGGLGLMNELANGCLSAGGDVYGVITERLLDMEAGHEGIQELEIVKTMHERKTLMCDAADCFILLPGGVGSYEEIFEIITSIRIHGVEGIITSLEISVGNMTTFMKSQTNSLIKCLWFDVTSNSN